MGDATKISDPADPVEQALVRRIRAGDVEAFEAVYRATFPSLTRFVVRCTGSRGIADDVVHDIFLNVWAQRSTLSIRTTIRAYLYGAVRQRALRYLRHQTVVDRSADASGPELAATLFGHVGSTDAPVERAELIEALRAAIQALPERQRLAMLLYLDDELTPVDIAMTLGVTAVAVRKLLAKATSRLREALPRF